MIRVVLADLTRVGAEGVLRSVSAELAADTEVSRRVELEAGSQVIERLRAMGGIPVGGAVITPGGGLEASFIIHVVTQSRDEPVRPEGVRSALLNGLRRAREWGLETLALPPLGCGAGNLDAEESASVMISLLQDNLREGSCPREVIVVVANEYEENVFVHALAAAERRASARSN